MDELKLFMYGQAVLIGGAASQLIVAWLRRQTRRIQGGEHDGLEG